MNWKKLVNEINKIEYKIEVEHCFEGKKFDGYMSYEDIHNILLEAHKDDDISDEKLYRNLYELIILGNTIFTLNLDNSQGNCGSMTYYCKVRQE